MATAKTPLRILCFGDSLTEGFCAWGTVYAPYSKAMTAVLREKIGDEFEVSVDTDGKSGEQVCLHFRGRMEGHYSSTRTGESPYDFVVFLGGTNDLAVGRPTNVIYEGIDSITAIPLEHGARILIMTVPECEVQSERLDNRRNEINTWVKADTREGVHVLDLHNKIPYWEMPEAERGRIWDDGLHLKPAGYDRMGTMVADALIEIIEGEKAET